MARKSCSVPFVSKKYQKQVAGCCRICKEPDYNLLDVHRIVEGSDGGKYSYDNVVVLCALCHRRQQAKSIRIVGWKHSTVGRILHWIDENGEDQFS
jgi:5-methylcytosine-specific restriction endonuclease McrA